MAVRTECLKPTWAVAAARLQGSNACQLASVALWSFACAPKREQKVGSAPGRGRGLYERCVGVDPVALPGSAPRVSACACATCGTVRVRVCGVAAKGGRNIVGEGRPTQTQFWVCFREALKAFACCSALSYRCAVLRCRLFPTCTLPRTSP